MIVTGEISVDVCPFCGEDVTGMRTANHLKVCRKFHEQWGPEEGPAVDLPSPRGD